MDSSIELTNNKIIGSTIGKNIHGGFEFDKIIICGNTIVNSSILTEINIPNFCNECEDSSNCMTGAEYQSFQRILKYQNHKEHFVKALQNHLLNFAEGILASIVASRIM